MGLAFLAPALLAPAPVQAQLGPDSLRFAVIADPQFADKVTDGSATATTSRCYRGTPAKMDSAVAFYNRLAPSTPAFLLILGDYVDGYTQSVSDSTKTMADLDTMNARTGRFQGDIYLVLGNHEQTSLNKTDIHSKSLSKIKQNFYSFDVGPFHFVVLDGNYTSNGAHYSRLAPWTWTDTWIHKPQRDWLIADLRAAGDRPTIVSIHQNLNGASTDDYSVNNADTIRTILETNGNVTHVFQGHKHEGGYTRINGIHYITFQAMLNCPIAATGTGTANGNNYSLVTIRDTTMFIDGQMRSPDRTVAHKGLAKAVWATSLKERGGSVNAGWNPLELTARSVKVRAEGAHVLNAHDAAGRLLSTRTGHGVTLYDLASLSSGVTGGMVVYTVRTEKGLFRKVGVGLGR